MTYNVLWLETGHQEPGCPCLSWLRGLLAVLHPLLQRGDTPWYAMVSSEHTEYRRATRAYPMHT